MTTKYKIVGKQFTGMKVTHLVIENEEGKHKSLEYENIIKLVKADKISNAHLEIDTTSGEYMLITDDKVSELKEIKKSNMEIELISRIVDSDDKCIGYKAHDNNGKQFKLSIDKIWELATEGNVNGVIGCFDGTNKIIKGEQLNKLPKIQN